jgi:hypothetical protein
MICVVRLSYWISQVPLIGVHRGGWWVVSWSCCVVILKPVRGTTIRFYAVQLCDRLIWSTTFYTRTISTTLSNLQWVHKTECFICKSIDRTYYSFGLHHVYEPYIFGCFDFVDFAYALFEYRSLLHSSSNKIRNRDRSIGGADGARAPY